MHSEPQRFVTGREPLIQWANAQSARYDHAGMSFDQIVHVHYLKTRGLLRDDAFGRRGGDVDIYLDLDQVLDPDRSCPAVRRRSWEESNMASGLGHREAMEPLDFATTVRAVSDHERRVPDVPLIIEDLLVRAKQLADAGAPREAIEEALDQVAALRDGLDS